MSLQFCYIHWKTFYRIRRSENNKVPISKNAIINLSDWPYQICEFTLVYGYFSILLVYNFDLLVFQASTAFEYCVISNKSTVCMILKGIWLNLNIRMFYERLRYAEVNGMRLIGCSYWKLICNITKIIWERKIRWLKIRRQFR